MVPYVRKSFYKHFIDGIEFFEQDIDKSSFNDELSIEAEVYKKQTKIYKYAMAQTNKELYQAVEGMYHNLNTLQSRWMSITIFFNQLWNLHFDRRTNGN